MLDLIENILVTSIAQQNNPKRRFLLAYLIGVHLILLILLFKTDFIPRVKAKLFITPVAPNGHVERMLVYHQAMDGSVPVGAALFLGDSITQSLAVPAVAPVAVNYGIGWATTSELLSNLPKYRSLKRASAVFLMIGINDIAQGKAEGLALRLRAIGAAIPADLPLVWSGIMPVYWAEIDSDLITSANVVIKEICAARAGCVYVNTEEIFSAGGAESFSDGVHLNDRGYEKWIASLKLAYQQVSRQKPT